MILLARTDTDAPKHRGISFFLLDMKSPGITIQPLVDMVGRHTFNQVFFDNVRVPRDASSASRTAAGTWPRPRSTSSARASSA